jgi:phage shock protein A
MDSSDAVRRFEAFEQRIDRMEAEADLVNLGRRGSLEQAFSDLSVDEEIEQQLRDLKSSLSRREGTDQDAT